MKNRIGTTTARFFNRETILYAFFGVLTSVENILLFSLLLQWSWEYKMANVTTMIIVKLTAYVCNKLFVFQSKTDSIAALAAEFARFVLARGATMVIEFFGMILMVEIIGLNHMLCKVLLTILVVIMNYVLGKKHVFNQKRTEY